MFFYTKEGSKYGSTYRRKILALIKILRKKVGKIFSELEASSSECYITIVQRKSLEFNFELCRDEDVNKGPLVTISLRFCLCLL